MASETTRAGFAARDITPDFDTELIGCQREDPVARGVESALLAQALVLENGGCRCCLTTVDSLGLTVALANDLRARIAEAIGTTAARVMLNFSHTHSAPAPLSDIGGERYRELLFTRAALCAKEALNNARPVQAAWALGTCDIADNRRDGCAIVDDRLAALRFSDADTGAPIATVLRVCAHANVLMAQNNAVSSDWLGRARDGLAERYHSPVMLLQGASGNLKPKGVDKILGGSTADADRVAASLVASASRLRFSPRDITRLGMLEKPVTLYADVPSEALAYKIAAEARAAFGTPGDAWLAACERLRESGVREQTLPSSMQFLRVNEGCFCGVPDEIFCELALEASKKAGAPLLLLSGYTNGCTGYLPTAEEWDKGGFETLYSYLSFYAFHGHVMPFRRDTAGRLVALACEGFKEIMWEGSRE